MIGRIFTLLMIGTVMASSIVAPVAAQEPQLDTVLLDQNTDEVGEVTIDGQIYQIHAIENALPYANGVEVYTNGDKVTSVSEAEAAIQAFSQKQAVDSLDADDLAAFRALEQDMKNITDATDPATAELDNTVLLLDDLKTEPGAGGQTVWEVARNQSLPLEKFNATQEPELRQDIQQWQTAAHHLETNTTALINLLERQENGEDVDPAVLYQQYVTTMNALETFNDQTTQLTGSLSGTATTSGVIATGVYGVPDHGEDLSLQFVTLGHQLELSSKFILEITAPISEHEDSLSDLQSMAESTQEELMDNWQNRSNAASQVYLTIIAVPLLFAALGGYVFRRRLGSWAATSWRDRRNR